MSSFPAIPAAFDRPRAGEVDVLVVAGEHSGDQHAAKLVAEGKAVLVDCREPKEWAETGVAQPAVLLAKSDFDGAQTEWKAFLAKNEGKEVILYCRSGNRAGIIAKALAEKGVNVANAGGLKDWTEAGLPTRKVEAEAPKK